MALGIQCHLLLLVLECGFHVGVKQVPTNVRMTCGKFEGGDFLFYFIFVKIESSLWHSKLQSVVTLYTLTSIMPLPLLYFEILGNKCSQFESPSFCRIYLACIMDFDVIIVIIVMVTLCYSIMLHATLILYYHTSMITLRIPSISCGLWLL